MCGRYTLIRLADFTDMFPWIRPPAADPPPRYNIAPTQAVAVVANDGKCEIDFFQWGLIPSWAKDPSIGSKLINARSETIAEKPAFRSALRRRRCIIPASGFYEWKKNPDGKTKTPMYIRMKDNRPFAFAGLWEVWHSDDGTRPPTCTIITGRPNELVGQIHDRMAVILPPGKYRQWLSADEWEAADLVELLQPYPPELMEAYAVSRSVNTPANDRAELIQPADPAEPPPAPRPRKGGSDQPTLF